MLEHHLADAGHEFNEALKVQPRYARPTSALESC